MRLILCAVLAFGATAFAADKKVIKKTTTTTTTTGAKPLYERLGGETAIRAVVEDFVGRASTNPKVNFLRQGKVDANRFANLDVNQLKERLVEFLSKATGGPDKYAGRDMKTTHAGMKITEAEFGALAGDLAASLDKFNVPKKEKDELMAIAASTKKDIVEAKM